MATMVNRLCLAFLAACFCSHYAFATNDSAQVPGQNLSTSVPQGGAFHPIIDADPLVDQHFKQANFEREGASKDVLHIANWVVDSGDNRKMPFVIIDKTHAKAFVFNRDGWLRGAAPVLLGLGRGDDSVPGIGDRPLSSMRIDERTTPAGRFVAVLGRSLHGEEILWIDYQAAISLHRVITSNPKEHRAQRLASPTPLDNRISYGCINVPAKFFDSVILPAFAGVNGVVYVLPETRPLRKVFASYGLYMDTRQYTASQGH